MEALKHRGLNQSDLAREIDVRPGTVSALLSGETSPKVETLDAICRTLKVYPTWLMLGVGQRYFEDSATEFAPVSLQNQAITERMPHGVDQWLADHPELSDDDRAWMRAVPWPMAHVRQPDLVYLTMLSAYRQAREAQPRPPSSPDGHRARP